MAGRKPKQEKKICAGNCKKNKVVTDFYQTGSKLFPDGRINICKVCLKEMVDVTNAESLKEVLRAVDKPYIDFIWANCLETKDPVGNLFRQLSSLHQYKNLTWKDSIEGSEEIPTRKSPAKSSTKDTNDDIEIPDHLRKKWGRGFSSLEILDFEDLYEEWKDSYRIQTSMHETFLKKAIIASVMMNSAIAKGDAKEASQFTAIFKEMTSAGKLQPNQMSKSDLSGGLDTFSQLVTEVEKRKDIIEVLPKFKAQPADKVDFAIWHYVNYERHLHGLPLCEYKDVYAFYGDRKRESANRLNNTEIEDW